MQKNWTHSVQINWLTFVFLCIEFFGVRGVYKLEAKRAICLGFFWFHSADDWEMEIAGERTKMSWPEWKKKFFTM